jgi:hypothetical protein
VVKHRCRTYDKVRDCREHAHTEPRTARECRGRAAHT